MRIVKTHYELYIDRIDDAYVWMESEINDSCIDNYRFAYLCDKTALIEYEKQQEPGCCGRYDMK